MMRRCFAVGLLRFCLHALRAGVAQDPAHQHPATSGWQWGVEGVVFVGYNYHTASSPTSTSESQNWLMTSLATSSQRFDLGSIGMLSLEPFTLRDIGSPQVFQTGETFGGAPLIDYQHPHDLIMNLGAEFSRIDRRHGADVRRLRGRPGADRAAGVHAPAVGGREPAGAASHHYLDSTHITPGVIASAWSAADAVRSRRVSGPGARRRSPDLDTGRSTHTAAASRGPMVRGPCKSPAPPQDARAEVAVRRTRLTASVSSRRAMRVARVAGGVRPESRSVRQPRGVPVRGDKALGGSVLHAGRIAWRKTFSTPASIRSARRIRTGNRRWAR